MRTLPSLVRGHVGPCKPTWLNRNEIARRIDGGTTGFFRNTRTILGFINVKTGEEFHGIIRGGVVYNIQDDPH